METPEKRRLSKLTYVITQGSRGKIMNPFHLALTFKGKKPKRCWYPLCASRGPQRWACWNQQTEGVCEPLLQLHSAVTLSFPLIRGFFFLLKERGKLGVEGNVKWKARAG